VTAIWSLCVSKVDLVTHILDIENQGDQIGGPDDDQGAVVVVDDATEGCASTAVSVST
jgi:hypothetical protein